MAQSSPPLLDGLARDNWVSTFTVSGILPVTWQPVLPEAMYQPRLFRQTFIATPASQIQVQAFTIWPTVTSPDGFIRPPWAPEHSWVAVPALPTVTVPGTPIRPMLPQSYLRQAWDPERTYCVTAPNQTITYSPWPIPMVGPASFMRPTWRIPGFLEVYYPYPYPPPPPPVGTVFGWGVILPEGWVWE